MSVVGAPVGIAISSFTLIFSLTTRIIKKLRSITWNKKKNHDNILMLAQTKFDSIETLVSQALIDMEISHEEFNAIIRENKNMKGWKKKWGMSVNTVLLKNKKIWDWIVWIQEKYRVCNWCVNLKQKIKWKTVKNY